MVCNVEEWQNGIRKEKDRKYISMSINVRRRKSKLCLSPVEHGMLSSGKGTYNYFKSNLKLVIHNIAVNIVYYH